MKRTRVLQEIRLMRFEEVYYQRRTGQLRVEEAARLLGIHERTFRRWVTRYEEEGANGLADRRLDKAAHNAAPADEVAHMLELFETHYPGFTASHFYDKYRYEHNGERSYTWVKSQLQDAGFVKKVKKRGAHRRRRPREPMKGMMLHQDGSTHEWVPDKVWDMIVTMDDADSEIYSAFFVKEEGTWSSFRGVRETIEEMGLFCSLYVDRGTHYFYTPKAGGKVDKKNPTQFGRSMAQLGIELIPAYSPEARGRSERMFRTLQSRLPKELQLRGITEMDEANRYLRETFLPEFNKRFMVKPELEDSAFVSGIDNRLCLDDILCIHTERTVNKDNTVNYKGKTLQIPKNAYRWSYQKAKVIVHEYEDGSLSLFHGPRCIGRYDKTGCLVKETRKDVA